MEEINKEHWVMIGALCTIITLWADIYDSIQTYPDIEEKFRSLNLNIDEVEKTIQKLSVRLDKVVN